MPGSEIGRKSTHQYLRPISLRSAPWFNRMRMEFRLSGRRCNAMPGKENIDRRGFLGIAAGAIAATKFGMNTFVGSDLADEAMTNESTVKPIKITAFETVKQIDAGLLNV